MHVLSSVDAVEQTADTNISHTSTRNVALSVQEKTMSKFEQRPSDSKASIAQQMNQQQQM